MIPLIKGNVFSFYLVEQFIKLSSCHAQDLLVIFTITKIADLVVVLHQLDDHPDVVAVVLDRDDPHDIGRVLRKIRLTQY